MKNKSGFISMALVYSFLIIFLFLMTAIIECYSQKNNFLEAISNKVNNDLGVNSKSKKTLINSMINDNTLLSSGDIRYNNIASNSKGNGKGLYYIENISVTDENNNCDVSNSYNCDPKKIYFYRGNVKNNYVVFGNMFDRYNPVQVSTVGTEKTETYTYNDSYMCWQIIRTNEDDSVRLVLYGTYNKSTGKCEALSGNFLTKNKKVYNTLYNDNAYVGYTYGTANSTNSTSTLNGKNDSTAKQYLDEWISKYTNLYNTFGLDKKIVYETKTGKDVEKSRETYSNLNFYLANAIYCNDKTISNIDTILGKPNTKLGYALNNTFYASSRYIDNGADNLTYKCLSDGYMYSLKSSRGGNNNNDNSGLDFNVGLLTINDVIFAGGKYGTENKDYFLYTGYPYWTMSPAGYYDGSANVFAVDTNGRIIDKAVNSTDTYVRPVINVSKDALVNSGSGLIDDPYFLVNID